MGSKRHQTNQPAVQLGRDFHLPDRPERFTIFSNGTKSGRYWGFARRPGQPSLWVEVRKALPDEAAKTGYAFIECKD